MHGLRQEVAALKAESADALRHLSVVRYDAFGDVGGHLSWSLAVLDDAGHGVVLTSIHGRSEARTYAKSITSWSCEQQLSPEEEEAIEHARPGEGPPDEGGTVGPPQRGTRTSSRPCDTTSAARGRPRSSRRRAGAGCRRRSARVTRGRSSG